MMDLLVTLTTKQGVALLNSTQVGGGSEKPTRTCQLGCWEFMPLHVASCRTELRHIARAWHSCRTTG